MRRNDATSLRRLLSRFMMTIQLTADRSLHCFRKGDGTQGREATGAPLWGCKHDFCDPGALPICQFSASLYFPFLASCELCALLVSTHTELVRGSALLRELRMARRQGKQFPTSTSTYFQGETKLSPRPPPMKTYKWRTYSTVPMTSVLPHGHVLLSLLLFCPLWEFRGFWGIYA